jgi:hypothetical protein
LKNFLQILFFFLLAMQICFAQWVQTNGLNDQQVPHNPLIGVKALQETPQQLLRHPTQHQHQAEFINRLDSIRASRMQSQLPNGRFIPNGIQNGVLPLNKILSPQSQISVIDTAIVQRLGYGNDDPGDTTRHLYSFNAAAKKTSDLTQKLTGGFWVDTLLETNTYDANNNMLTELYEYWSNGQWVNSDRGTCTYDANNNMLTGLWEYWSNGQWVNSYRYAYTYDPDNNMLSELYEQWSSGQLVNSYRITYTYDVNNNMLTELYENWSNGQWVNDWRGTYTYDAQGGLTSASFFEWVNSSWSPMDYRNMMGWWLSDNAGNFYNVRRGYNYTFIRKVIVTGVASEIGNIAAAYSLSQNYPNPFNPNTKISWQLPIGSQATLKVYDILGREVATLVNEYKQAGKYETEFNAEILPSGVYFYQLKAGDYVNMKKMILIK